MNNAASTTIILRLEGLAVGLLCVWLYHSLHQPWWIFVVLFLTPDLSMFGYLGGPRVGAAFYNTVHAWVTAVILFFAIWYLWGDSSFLLSLPFILGAHIGIDRALGYGLKLPTSFRDTHLGRIGRAA